MKKSGILLHPTSLVGPYGIGDIGPCAYRFIDNLYKMKQTLWQILPIGPTDLHNSPYSSLSTFAGNHLLISLDLLVEDNLLDFTYIDSFTKSKTNKINFKEIIKFKLPLLEKVAFDFNSRASKKLKESFKKFCLDHSYWLDDYAKYWALKKENDMKPWIDWQTTSVHNKNNIEEAKIVQFLFHDQWARLRQYCTDRNIKIIGDMPIYVGYDSADVYSHRELFQLDQSGRMSYQSGCPPCNFQKNGQLWGNPIYDWDSHKRSNFEWWVKRFKKLFEMVDIIRLDHFIGYDRYFRIPISHKTAINGEWMPAPGKELFNTINKNISNFNVFVEDLGDVTGSVIKLRDENNFPGIRVLQFDMDTIPNIENFSSNTVVCTGTHDNDTLIGWFESLPLNSKNQLSQNKLLQYFNCDKDKFHWEIISFALGTNCNLVIIPFQDILGLGSSSRFNVPGTLSKNNWSWMMEEEKLTSMIINRLSRLTMKYNRNTTFN